MGHPFPPSCWQGKSLMEGASQILGTNDSTLLQLKPPHPSHVEGPVSPRCLSLVTYPNPSPSSLTIPRNKRIKATPTRSGRGLPRPASFGSRNPTQEGFPIKSLLDTFGVLVFYLTLSFSWRSSCRTWAGPSTSACWDPAGQHGGFLPGAQRPVVGQWKDGPRGWGSGPVVQQIEEMLGDGAGECAPVEKEPSVEDLGWGDL